jgi:hypothetical protein
MRWVHGGHDFALKFIQRHHLLLHIATTQQIQALTINDVIFEEEDSWCRDKLQVSRHKHQHFFGGGSSFSFVGQSNRHENLYCHQIFSFHDSVGCPLRSGRALPLVPIFNRLFTENHFYVRPPTQPVWDLNDHFCYCLQKFG